MAMRYKCWRSYQDYAVHVICRQNDQFQNLPAPVLWMGPFADSIEGDVERLKPHYRLMLAEQGFVVVYEQPTKFTPEVG